MEPTSARSTRPYYNSRHASHEDIKLSLKDIKTEYNKALEQIEVLNLEKSNLTAALNRSARTTKTNEDLQKDLSCASDRPAQTLRRSTAQKALEDAEGRVAELGEENIKLRKLLDSNMARLEQLEKDISLHQDQADKIEYLQAYNQHLIAEMEALNKEFSAVTKKVDGLDEEKAAAALNQSISSVKYSPDFTQTYMKYVNIIAQAINNFDQKHFVRSSFEEIFPQNADLSKLYESKKYGEIMLKSVKFIAELLSNSPEQQQQQESRSCSPFAQGDTSLNRASQIIKTWSQGADLSRMTPSPQKGTLKEFNTSSSQIRSQIGVRGGPNPLDRTKSIHAEILSRGTQSSASFGTVEYKAQSMSSRAATPVTPVNLRTDETPKSWSRRESTQKLEAVLKERSGLDIGVRKESEFENTGNSYFNDREDNENRIPMAPVELSQKERELSIREKDHSMSQYTVTYKVPPPQEAKSRDSKERGDQSMSQYTVTYKVPPLDTRSRDSRERDQSMSQYTVTYKVPPQEAKSRDSKERGDQSMSQYTVTYKAPPQETFRDCRDQDLSQYTVTYKVPPPQEGSVEYSKTKSQKTSQQEGSLEYSKTKSQKSTPMSIPIEKEASSYRNNHLLDKEVSGYRNNQENISRKASAQIKSILKSSSSQIISTDPDRDKRKEDEVIVNTSSSQNNKIKSVKDISNLLREKSQHISRILTRVGSHEDELQVLSARSKNEPNELGQMSARRELPANKILPRPPAALSHREMNDEPSLPIKPKSSSEKILHEDFEYRFESDDASVNQDKRTWLNGRNWPVQTRSNSNIFTNNATIVDSQRRELPNYYFKEDALYKKVSFDDRGRRFVEEEDEDSISVPVQQQYPFPQQNQFPQENQFYQQREQNKDPFVSPSKEKRANRSELPRGIQYASFSVSFGRTGSAERSPSSPERTIGSVLDVQMKKRIDHLHQTYDVVKGEEILKKAVADPGSPQYKLHVEPGTSQKKQKKFTKSEDKSTIAK